MRSLSRPSITRRRARDRKLSPGRARLAPLFVNVQVQLRRVDCLTGGHKPRDKEKVFASPAKAKRKASGCGVRRPMPGYHLKIARLGSGGQAGAKGDRLRAQAIGCGNGVCLARLGQGAKLRRHRGDHCHGPDARRFVLNADGRNCLVAKWEGRVFASLRPLSRAGSREAVDNLGTDDASLMQLTVSGTNVEPRQTRAVSCWDRFFRMPDQ